jgi:hypothetical protein
MTCHLGEIFLVKCQKQAFSFNKREAKVREKNMKTLLKKNIYFSFMHAGGLLAQYAKMPWLEP